LGINDEGRQELPAEARMGNGRTGRRGLTTGYKDF
jgi:hypothetical protein